jgi:hypothetical protein
MGLTLHEHTLGGSNMGSMRCIAVGPNGHGSAQEYRLLSGKEWRRHKKMLPP